MPTQTETVHTRSNVPDQARRALQASYNPQLMYEHGPGAEGHTKDEQEAARIACYLASLARQETVVVSAGPCSSRVVSRLGSLGTEVVEVVQGL